MSSPLSGGPGHRCRPTREVFDTSHLLPESRHVSGCPAPRGAVSLCPWSPVPVAFTGPGKGASRTDGVHEVWHSGVSPMGRGSKTPLSDAAGHVLENHEGLNF